MTPRKRQNRSHPLASATEAGSSITQGPRDSPRSCVTQTKPSSAPVSASTASSDCLGENDRSSTPLNDALSKSDSTLTIRATSEGSKERHSVDRGSEDSGTIGHSSGQGNDRPDHSNCQRDQQVMLLLKKSSTISATDAASLEKSEPRNIANVGGQRPAIHDAIVTAPKHATTQGGASCDRYRCKRSPAEYLVGGRSRAIYLLLLVVLIEGGGTNDYDTARHFDLERHRTVARDSF